MPFMIDAHAGGLTAVRSGQQAANAVRRFGSLPVCSCAGRMREHMTREADTGKQIQENRYRKADTGEDVYE